MSGEACKLCRKSWVRKRRDCVSNKKDVQAAIDARREQVAAFMRRGMRQREMAHALNVSDAVISRDVKAIEAKISERAARGVQMDRELQRERLDAAVNAIWPAVEKGDAAAVRNLVRLVDRIAKLSGLDAPVKVEQTIDIRERLRELAEREGLDPDSVVAEAERYLREIGR